MCLTQGCSGRRRRRCETAAGGHGSSDTRTGHETDLFLHCQRTTAVVGRARGLWVHWESLEQQSRPYNVALLLQIPIFDGLQREGRIAESRSQLRQDALRLQSIV